MTALIFVVVEPNNEFRGFSLIVFFWLTWSTAVLYKARSWLRRLDSWRRSCFLQSGPVVLGGATEQDDGVVIQAKVRSKRRNKRLTLPLLDDHISACLNSYAQT